MKAQMFSPEEVTLSRGDALKAFRRWISAELLDKQRHWLGAESKRQKRKKADLLREAPLHRTKPWRTGVRTSRQENRRRVKLVDDQIPRLWPSVGLAPRAPDASR